MRKLYLKNNWRLILIKLLFIFFFIAVLSYSAIVLFAKNPKPFLKYLGIGSFIAVLSVAIMTFIYSF